MGSKLIFSAPKRSISYWSLAAISCSVMPGWINFRISEKARSVISWAFVIRAISPSSLAARSVHQLLSGHQLGGEALLPEVIVRHRQIALLKAQLPDAAAVDDLLHHSPVVAAAAGHGDLRAGDEVIAASM